VILPGDSLSEYRVAGTIQETRAGKPYGPSFPFLLRRGMEEGTWKMVLDPGNLFGPALDWPFLLPLGVDIPLREGATAERFEPAFLAKTAPPVHWTYRVSRLADSAAVWSVRRQPAEPLPLERATQDLSVEIRDTEISWSLDQAGVLRGTRIRHVYTVRLFETGSTVEETTVNELRFDPPMGAPEGEEKRWTAMERIGSLLPGQADEALLQLWAIREQAPGGVLGDGYVALEERIRRDLGLMAKPEALWKYLQGKPAPDFRLQRLTGDSLSLSDLRGSAVLLNFFSVRCGPCLKELPFLKELYETYARYGLQIVLVNAWNDTPDTLASFALQEELPFTILLDGRKVTRELYFVRGIPFNVFVDADGIYRAWISGYNPTREERFRTLIQRILFPVGSTGETPR
jgi:peroxiredoxin